MDKENSSSAMGNPIVRITRARAKALGTSGTQFPKPPLPVQKRASRANTKRGAVEENKISTAAAFLQNKRRAVFADISNALRKNVTLDGGSKGSILQKCLGSKQPMKPITRNSYKVIPVVTGESQVVKLKIANNASKVKVISGPLKLKTESGTTESAVDNCEVLSPPKVEENLKISLSSSSGHRVTIGRPVPRKFKSSAQLQNLFKKAGKCDAKPEGDVATSVINIDSKHKDPLMCTAYAADIHNHIYVAELSQRPSSNYMDKLQHDITHSMRAILIDWLVEVSEEYKLVPDTLYLTVNLIDRFLSQCFIEKQRLQLLGVTCMLIASKYEEITVPRVEEFCFITDNTYNREEVVKMESEVLNLLRFQLSVPTVKTFLRRFIQAAQATSENPSVDMEYLSNYLAELTLLDCSFHKYLPSLIAASAVFLARWTLNPSDHPWNPTLEHYTCYKPVQLKETVVALQDLQSNKKGCTLNAIREKYRQGKFVCVANLSSMPLETLFIC